MIIELHAIQSFGPSNLNRDDTGNPKEALFGGVMRARISSQSAKHAMRKSFPKTFDHTGKRTKRLATCIADKLQDKGVDREWAVAKAGEFVTKIDQKFKKKDMETSVLIYISNNEVEAVVEALLQAYQSGEPSNKKAWEKWREDMAETLSNQPSDPDIALFGRMLADSPSLNINAACQVAHAISTHAVNTEFDFYTAIDDLQSEAESGAAMMGYINFNSATYYRCVRIDWEQLKQNLGGDADLARQTVSAFMTAFALVVPTGMQNSFINKHQPDFLLAAARPNNDGQSLANAFETPVKNGRESGYAEPSIAALCQYWDQVEGAFRLAAPSLAVLNPRGHELVSEELTDATVANLGEWIGVVTAALSED